jgi:hypothetical protein
MSTIRLFFSRDTEDSAATIDSANYVVTGGATISSVVRRSGKVVDLIMTEALIGSTTYTVEATINDSNGNPINSQKDLVTITTDAGPQVSSVSWADEDELDVTFSEAVDETTAEDTGHYTVTGATTPAVSSATLQAGGTVVRLVLDANMEPNGAYNVEVSGHVKSATAGIGVEPAHDDADVHVWVFKDVTPAVYHPPITSSDIGHNMAEDVANGVMVHYFSTGGVYYTSTFDGTSWVDKAPAHHPGSVQNHALCWDGTRVICFGGYNGSLLQDTYLWNGTDWTLTIPAHMPTARRYHAMAYDPDRGKVVMYGGTSTNQYEWDGADWTYVDLVSGPGNHLYHDMAYDEERNQMVLVGYLGASAPRTYTYNSSNRVWTTKSPDHTPTGSYKYFEICYDPLGKRILLFGGEGVGYSDKLWSWDGTDWTDVSALAGTKPSARRQCSIRNFSGWSNRIVAYGGYDGSALHDTFSL